MDYSRQEVYEMFTNYLATAAAGFDQKNIGDKQYSMVTDFYKLGQEIHEELLDQLHTTLFYAVTTSVWLQFLLVNKSRTVPVGFEVAYTTVHIAIPIYYAWVVGSVFLSSRRTVKTMRETQEIVAKMVAAKNS